MVGNGVLRRVVTAPVLVTLLLGALLVLAVDHLYTETDERGPIARLTLDGFYYHSYLASFFHDRDLDFTNEYRITGNWERIKPTKTGYPGNPFAVGAPIFTAPFFFVGTLFEPGDHGGFGDAEVQVALLASPIYSLLAVVFVFRLVRRRLGSPLAGVFAPILLGVAGPVLFYAIRQPGYAHPVATFLTAWLVDFWDASYDRPRRFRTWIFLGLLLGAAAMVRTQLGLWGILLGLAALDDWRREGVRALPKVAVGALATVVAVIPQLNAWRVIYGSLFTVPQGPGFMVWTHPMWSETLFSSRDGLFSWTPLYAVAAVGLFGALRSMPRLVGALLVGIALQTLANGAAWDWWGGTSYGARRFDSCFVAFAFGLAWIFTLGRRWRPVGFLVSVPAVVLAVACAWGNYDFVKTQSVWTLMGGGGSSPTVQIARQVRSWRGTVVIELSRLVTWPARALFAWRHGASMDAYDRIVGPHFLTEVYTGLGGPQKPVEDVPLNGSEPFLIGFERGGTGARLVGDHGTILVPLNKRHGPVYVTFDSQANLTLTWDGKPAPGGVLDPIERGVHELGVSATPGTTLSRMRLQVKPGTPP